MSETAIGSTATITPATGATAPPGAPATDPDTFSDSLKAGIAEARDLATSSLGSMISQATSSGSGPYVAVSQPPWAAQATAPAGEPSAVNGTGKVVVPEELKQYGNGRIPGAALELVGIKGHKLFTTAAQSFKAMRAAAAADGIDISITDSYRDYDEQVDLVRRKGLYSQGGLAARPGTSNHGWGMAVDMDVTTAGLAWLRTNGAGYGWVEAVPREPWHWEFQPARR